jgi:hypothetical protein
MTFEWENPASLLDQVVKLLEERAGRFKRIPERAIRRAAPELQARVMELAPKRTSTLVRSIGFRVERGADSVTATVGTHMAYAPFVEYGTGVFGPARRPIVVAAKRKRGLFWGAYDAKGRPVVRRSVKIQGMQPRAMFGQAMRGFLPRYEEIIAQELAREAQA